MRGPVDSSISITVQRTGVDQPIDYKIMRAIIKVRSVRTRLEGEDIVYVRITSFTERTSDELEKGVKELIEKQDGKVKGIVLDLRNNPGGLLDQAVQVSDDFLEQGEVVSTRGRRADSIQRFNAREGDIASALPMVVLINSGSASASEIVAGALQDHRRALLLGTRSFGKGSVQTIIPLGGQGAIRLTTARYYTPSGRSIQAKGIDPDILVEQAKIDRLASGQPRSEAELRGHLENPDDASKGTKPETGAAPEAKPKPEETEAPEPAKPDAKPGAAAPDGDAAATPPGGTPAPEDYQLTRALDLLRGYRILSDKPVAVN